jgi:glycosyltransferase involved in cell wall biosynthesis
VTFLIDVHHIGGHQTGNETLARNIGRELVPLAAMGELQFATTTTGRAQVAAMTGAEPLLVAESALRRVLLDLPRLATKVEAAALLVQYTKPATRRPCAVMIHDLSPFHPQSAEWLNWRFRTRVRASINHSARSAAVLIACSEFTRRGLLDRYSLDTDRVILAPSAVDPELARLLDAATTNRPDRTTSTLRVIAVGNVLPRKNLAVLGSALAALRKRGTTAELRVVGSIPASGTAIADDLRRALGEAVSFTGYVSTEQLAIEYAQADLLAFPSLFEGFGIPAIEAMYAGVPVIASDAGSLPEIVADAGTIVPATDQSAWTDALGQLLDDSALRAKLATLGRDRALATNWRTTAAIVLGALRQAAGR